MSLSTGIFPEPLKTAIVKPLLKKPTLDCTSFRNFRPVSNIAFMSKVIEKVIAFQSHSHMIRHNMFEELQSAYKTHHSTETTLVKVFNDNMLNVDSGWGSFLVVFSLQKKTTLCRHSRCLSVRLSVRPSVRLSVICGNIFGTRF